MTCLHHPDLTLVPEPSKKWGDLLICPNRACNYAVSANRQDTATTPVDASRSHGDAREDSPASSVADSTERLLVARIISKLESAGYEVLRVGQLRAKWSGTDIGYPDLSVRHPATFPVGIACLLEVKTATGQVRKRQAELNAAGWSYIVRSAEQALEVMDNAARQVAAVVREGGVE